MSKKASKSKATLPNTGMSITRSENKFTVKWKIAAKNVKLQQLRYRTHNGQNWGSWTQIGLSNGASSYSFELNAADAITQIQAQTRIQTNKKKTSEWDSASATYKVTTPDAPSVVMTTDAANKTTFTITSNEDTTSSAWYYRTEYRTRLSNGDWSAWNAADASYTYTDNIVGVYREIEVRNKGAAGYSEVKQASHYLGKPPIATWGTVDYSETLSYYELIYNINLSGSTLTIDKITPQYYIGAPTSDMECPTGANYVDGVDYLYNDSAESYTLAINTSEKISEDECMWARIKTDHDGLLSYSDAYRVITGMLTAPTCTITMSTPTPSGFTVNISDFNAGTEVAGTYVQVFLEKASMAGIENYTLIGAFPSTQATAAIASTEDITGEAGYAIHVRVVTADGMSMKSDFYDYTTSMPTAPTLDGITPSTVAGKVHVDWTNNWADATGTVIAWTDDPDNWTSNDEPELYEVTQPASGWYIKGLETGKVWYFRVRSVKNDGDSITYSAWSDEVAINLASAPAIPVLYLSDETITEGGMVTAYWSYVTTDGTSQIAGEVVEATFNNDVWTYGTTPVGITTSAQHIDIYAADAGWTNGDTVYLALRTRSGSGGTSDYSTPVKLEIAALPTVAFASTSLANANTIREEFAGDGNTTSFICAYNLSGAPTVTVDGTAVTASYNNDTVTLSSAPADGTTVMIEYTTTDIRTLTSLPMTVSTNSSHAERLTLIIERLVDYPIRRPDGEVTACPAGETIYLSNITSASGTDTFTVNPSDLMGRLDDGAYYALVAAASDSYGQTAMAVIPFMVHWAHQAEAPTATFTTDGTDYIVRITPIAPASYASGDTCDIYRLSADKPELIIKGAEFGTEYVDPYPAFGEFSGYKLVTVTSVGDYITDANTFADLDTTEQDPEIYAQLDPETLVIDFADERVELPYNITLGNKWEKDFERTKYLGGSVVGDHNKAVTRDMSVATVLVRDLDEDVAVSMRALARHAGLCHVRTPEGSSFTASVQVSEDRGFDSATIDYNLTIQVVDTVGFDGMTYAEWVQINDME